MGEVKGVIGTLLGQWAVPILKFIQIVSDAFYNRLAFEQQRRDVVCVFCVLACRNSGTGDA